MNEMEIIEVTVEQENCKAESGTITDKNTVEITVTRPDKWMAIWMFFVAYLAVEWFWIGTNHAYYGAGVFAYTMVYGLTVAVYAMWCGHRPKPEGIFWFGIMALCGFSYVWVYNHSLMMFLALFLRLVSLYYTAVVFEVLLDGKTGRYFVVDSVLMIITVPFKNLMMQIQIARRKIKKMKLTSEVFCGLAGCLVAAPLFAVIIWLLSGADDNFAGILKDGFRFFFTRWGSMVWTGILSLPVGAYLYGQMFGCARRRGTDAITGEMVQKELKSCAVVPGAGMYPALIGVVLLYLLFISLQGGYYLDALHGVLPEEFTYSVYARQGFFELVLVSMINLGIICLAQLLYRRNGRTKDGVGKDSRFLKYHTVVLSILTLFLIATAMAKMILYIKAYGLTPLRVIPSVFMVFLAMVFVLLAASRFVRIPVMRISVCLFAAGFTVMALCGMDGRIASYNLARYQAGTLDGVPRASLVRGSLASVPSMYRLWCETEDEQLKAELVEIAGDIRLNNWSAYHQPDSFSGLNLEKRTAIAALHEMQPQLGSAETSETAKKAGLCRR